MSEWQPIETAPEDQEVMTKIHDACGCRNEQHLRLKDRVWWFPDMSMYVYFVPTHWKPIESTEAK